MTGGGRRTLTSVSLHHHGGPETVKNNFCYRLSQHIVQRNIVHMSVYKLLCM